MPIGPTGRFPQGKFNEQDEGELAIGLAMHENKIVVSFGTPILWTVMDIDTAERFAVTILKMVCEIREKKSG